MSETLIVTLGLVLNALVPYLIVKRDLSRLGAETLARAWTDASFLSAVIAFGPLSLPIHFTKTRRTLSGLGLGLGWLVVAVAAQALVTTALGALLGVD